MKRPRKKMEFYKNKNIFKIDDIDVDEILVSKKESYGTNKSFNNLIGIVNSDNDNIKPSSKNFLKWLATLNTLKVIRQCLSMLLIINH